MVIDFPPHIEQAIIQEAQAQGLSVADLIANLFMEKQEVNPMIEAVMSLEPSAHFQNVDAVALQREWRDEWR